MPVYQKHTVTSFLNSFSELEGRWLFGEDGGEGAGSVGSSVCLWREGLEVEAENVAAHSLGAPFSGISIFGTARGLVD